MMVVFAMEGTGVIEGGWNFVWAAYGATWLFFGFYTVTLLFRSTTPPDPHVSKETP